MCSSRSMKGWGHHGFIHLPPNWSVLSSILNCRHFSVAHLSTTLDLNCTSNGAQWFSCCWFVHVYTEYVCCMDCEFVCWFLQFLFLSLFGWFQNISFAWSWIPLLKVSLSVALDRMNRWMNGWMMDGWIDRYMGKWINGWIYGEGCMGKWINGWIYEDWIDIWGLDGWMDGYMRTGWMNGSIESMDGWEDGWMDEWMHDVEMDG